MRPTTRLGRRLAARLNENHQRTRRRLLSRQRRDELLNLVRAARKALLLAGVAHAVLLWVCVRLYVEPMAGACGRIASSLLDGLIATVDDGIGRCASASLKIPRAVCLDAHAPDAPLGGCLRGMSG